MFIKHCKVGAPSSKKLFNTL
jgi:hypothetical protein